MVIRCLRILLVVFTALVIRFTNRTHNKDHRTHVFAVGIFGQTLVDFLIFKLRQAWIDEIPESYRAIRGTCYELRQVFLFLATKARKWLVV